MSTRTLGVLIIAVLVPALQSCLPTTTPPATAPPTVVAEPELPVLPEPYDTRQLARRANVRSEPSTSSDIIGTFNANTDIGLLELKTGWYQVLVDSSVGWVYAPLVRMNRNDRFAAALSYLTRDVDRDSVFVAKFQDEDNRLRIVLDMGWRELSDRRKKALVERTGDVWRDANHRMGIESPPPIRFMSNNDVEMAKWHGFFGATVIH
jgi:hypothetical protein